LVPTKHCRVVRLVQRSRRNASVIGNDRPIPVQWYL
jgi:hypothetical protein